METHSSVLAWKIPQTEEPGSLQSMGITESDKTVQAHTQAHYIYCAIYFYYDYISCTSDHQTLDPRGWGPLLYITLYFSCVYAILKLFTSYLRQVQLYLDLQMQHSNQVINLKACYCPLLTCIWVGGQAAVTKGIDFGKDFLSLKPSFTIYCLGDSGLGISPLYALFSDLQKNDRI